MATSAINLPEGFVLENEPMVLPEGFVLENQPSVKLPEGFQLETSTEQTSMPTQSQRQTWGQYLKDEFSPQGLVAGAKRAASLLTIPRDIGHELADPIAENVLAYSRGEKGYGEAWKDMAVQEYEKLKGLAQGASRAMGEPLGIYGVDAAKEAWTQRPVESVFGIAPIVAPPIAKGMQRVLPTRQQKIAITPQAKDAYRQAIKEIRPDLVTTPQETQAKQIVVKQLQNALKSNDISVIESVLSDWKQGQVIEGTKQIQRTGLALPAQTKIEQQPSPQQKTEMPNVEQVIADSNKQIAEIQNRINQLNQQKTTLNENLEVKLPQGFKLEKPTQGTSPETTGGVAQKVMIGKSPQTYTIVKEIESTPQEQELGEKYYEIKNDRTGEVLTTEAKGLRFVKQKPSVLESKNIVWDKPEQSLDIIGQIKNNITKKIRLDQAFYDHFGKQEGLSIIRKYPGLFSKNAGVTFDEVADGLNITTDSLADKLRGSFRESGKSKEISYKDYEEFQANKAEEDLTDFPFGKNIKDLKSITLESGSIQAKEPWQMTKAEFEKDKNIVYHGTHTDFDYFDRDYLGSSSRGGAGTEKAWFFSEDKDMAEYWGKQAQYANKQKGKKPIIKEIILNSKNRLKFDFNKYTRDDNGNKKYHNIDVKEGSEIEDLIKIAEEKGYDAIHVVNIKDTEDMKPRNMWIVLNDGIIDIINHKKSVEKALSEGKPVPPEVLKDYPDLQKTTITLESGGFQTGYEAIRDQLVPGVKKSIEKLEPTRKKFVEFWYPLSTIPQSKAYQYKRYQAMGSVARIENTVNKIWEKTSELPDDSKFQMFEYLDGQIPKEALPKEIQRYAQTLQGLNRRIGKMLVDRDLISQDAWEKHKNQYIRYSYLKHILGDKYDSVVGGKIDVSALKARKDLSPEYRKAIGLIEDVSIAEPISVSKALQNVVAYDRLAEIADNPEWVWQGSVVKVDGKKWGVKALEEEIQNIERVVKAAPQNQEAKAYYDKLKSTLEEAEKTSGKFTKDYMQLPDTWTYGKLKGMVVRKEIYNDIVPLVSNIQLKGNISKTLNTLMSIEREGMNLFKVSKTGLNPPTAARNIVSNIVQLNLSGTPLHQVFEYSTKALKTIKDKNPMYYQAMRDGIFKTNFIEGEINEIHNEIKDMAGKNWLDIVGHAKKLGKYYGKIDDVFKLAKYIEQLEKGETRQTATLEAQKWGMDYSLAHPSVKYARRHILPFASYQYKILPLLAESATKRPWVLGKYLLIPPVVTALALKAHKMNDDDWEKLKKQMPMAVKKYGTMLMPWKSKEGNYQWIDMSPYVPFQNIMSATQKVKQGNYFGLSQDVGITNPYADIYAMIKSSTYGKPPRDPYTGKEIYSQLDEPEQKAMKTLTWIYNKWAPTILTQYGTAGKITGLGEKDKYGRETTIEDVGRSIVGVNVIEPTPKQMKLQRKAQIKELRTSLYRKITDPTISRDEKIRAKKKFGEEANKILQGQY